MLIIGMGFFQLGAETAMTLSAKASAAKCLRAKKIIIIIVTCFFYGCYYHCSRTGFAGTCRTGSVNSQSGINLTVALGVGIFTNNCCTSRVIQNSAFGNSVYNVYTYFCYSAFVPANFLSVAFDAGGVTTGPITVPFIMALGIGLSSARSDKDGSRGQFRAYCAVQYRSDFNGHAF